VALSLSHYPMFHHNFHFHSYDLNIYIYILKSAHSAANDQ
jgi:hypothetical protein